MAAFRHWNGASEWPLSLQDEIATSGYALLATTESPALDDLDLFGGQVVQLVQHQAVDI